MVPIKNGKICLITTINAIGIILNFVLSNKKFCISDKNSYSYEYSKKMAVMILSGISIYFTFTLLLTININNPQQNQETQGSQINHSNQLNQPNRRNQGNNSHNNGGGGTGTINCGGGGGDCAPLLIIVLVIIVLILVIFLLVQIYKALGRKNTVYCSLIFLSIIYMGISIICFSVIHHVNFYIIGGISSCLFIFNFLAILIPNCRKRQRNNNIENIEIKDPILIKENSSNSILVNDKCVTTPMYNLEDNFKMNEIEKPIESLNPIDVFERNNEKYDQCFDDKNELLNHQNGQISQTPNSRISDLSNAPLPNDVDLPTEEEIFKNNSNL